MTDEKSHTEAAGAHDAPQATSIRKNETCALGGQEKRSGGHLDPITATRATAGQFGHPADGGLIEREEAVHALKIDVQPMTDLLSGDKTGEVRRDDRGFSVGDTVNLTCADGRTATRRITHIQRGYGLPDDLCVLSYASATPAAQPLLPGAQVGSEPGIPAAQPAQMVKPLVWEDLGADYWCVPSPLFGSIRIEPWGDRGFHVLWSVPGICARLIADLFATVEAAKAAAQSDYEARILSALEPAAQDGAEVELVTDADELRAELRRALAQIDSLEAECDRLHAQTESAKNDVYRLAVAICGGEDFPGLLDAQPIEALVQAAHGETINALLKAEAERAALKAEWDIAARNRDDALSLCREAQMECDKLKAEVERLREALTPSGDTKAAFVGEFYFDVDDRDDDGNEIARRVYVPWTTVKEIMAAIKARAALRTEQKGDA